MRLYWGKKGKGKKHYRTQAITQLVEYLHKMQVCDPSTYTKRVLHPWDPSTYTKRVLHTWDPTTYTRRVLHPCNPSSWEVEVGQKVRLVRLKEIHRTCQLHAVSELLLDSDSNRLLFYHEWQPKPRMLAVRRVRQEDDLEFEISLSYTGSFKPA